MTTTLSLPALRWHEDHDLPTLCTLFQACFPRDGWTPQKLRACVRDPEGVLKVLDGPQGRPAGALLYAVGAGRCEVRRVGVAPGLRRQGLGTRMLAALVAPGSVPGAALVSAQVREDDLPALLFFRDCGLGFAFDPREPREVGGDGLDRYRFTLRRPARRRRS